MILEVPATAAGNGLTVTTTLLLLAHPVAVIVSVTVYVVVTAGFTDGLARVDENPAGTEIQLYVLPVTAAAPNIVLCPAQIARSLPANAAGNGFTVTTTLLLLVHPVAVIVSVTVYVVVTTGLTDGFASVDVKPAGTELQLYVLPATAAAPITVLCPAQMILEVPATAAGNGLTVTTTLLLLAHPVAVIVSVTVYVVVTAGFTDGLARVDVNPTGTEIQLYVLPAIAAAPIIVLCPAQIARSLPANAAGNGFTVTTTLLLLVHPVAVIVSVTVYVVVTAGLTDGFASVEVKPAGTELQLYVLPATVAAPITVLCPAQMILADPATAAGNGLTVTTTLLLLAHPVAVIVSVTVYVVVTAGLTDGLARVDENPAGTEIQLYVLPVTAAAPNIVLCPAQIARSLPANAAGNGFTVTTRLLLLAHPVAVTVSVTVYVVVTAGLTDGFASVDVKPAGTELQLYVLPATAAAPITVLCPAQMILADPATAAGNGLTVTTTLLLLAHPVAVIVSVTVYVVVTAGFTDGLARVDENPAGTEIQLYVLPVTAAAPKILLCPTQIARSLPANAAGNGFTVTTALLLLVHPVAVIVSVTVYVVVTTGFTDGLARVDVNPAGTEIQLYVLPAIAAAPIIVLCPAQTDLYGPAIAPGCKH